MRIDNQLFNEILDDIEAYIPKLEMANNSVSELLYEPLTDEGRIVLGQYLRGLVELVQTLIITLDDASDHAPTLITALSPSLEQVTNSMTTLEQNLAGEQYVQVADLMKYRISGELAVMLAAIKESR